MTLDREVLAYIHDNCQGRTQAIPAKKLAAVMSKHYYGVCEREIRDIISGLRKLGSPIASAVDDPVGFFWPKDEAEFTAAMGHFYKRFGEMNAVVKGFERGLKEIFGSQLKLGV